MNAKILKTYFNFDFKLTGFTQCSSEPKNTSTIVTIYQVPTRGAVHTWARQAFIYICVQKTTTISITITSLLMKLNK